MHQRRIYGCCGTLAGEVQIPDFLAQVSPFDVLTSSVRRAIVERLLPRRVAAREILFEQGAPGGPLYLIRSGQLSEWSATGFGEERLVRRFGPGEIVGVVALVTAGMLLATVRADTECELLELGRDALDDVEWAQVALKPVLDRFALDRLSSFHLAVCGVFDNLNADLRAILASTTTWVKLQRGEILFRQGDEGDALYVVAHGRLQVVVQQPRGEPRPVAEIGRGQPVGEMALLVGGPRTATIRAMRDTDLVRLSGESFNSVVERQPSAAVPLTRTLVTRLQAVTSGRKISPNPGTIAVVTVDDSRFRLGPALVEQLGTTFKVCCVDSERFDSLHGAGASERGSARPRALYLREWMSRLEEDHDLVIYEAHTGNDNWTARCLAQADRVILVAPADAQDVEIAAEHWLQAVSVAPTIELVLLHPATRVTPRGTSRWFERHSVQRHHHIARDDIKGVRRLARSLTGRSIGLVLGSGGARGFAHLGALRALEEAGLPIDYVGGASMGALVGALIADKLTIEEIVSRIRHVFVDKPRGYRYTVPVVSLIDPRESERRIGELFAERGVEDLWLDFFCVSSNISQARLQVHDRGLLASSLRASMAIPGLLPPVFQDGDVLVDGAMLNNIPCDVMQRFCPGPVVACDVSRALALKVPTDLDRCPGPARQIWDRVKTLCGWPVGYPGIASILTTSVDCSAATQKEETRALAWLYLTPPVESFGMLETERIDEIVDIGYTYTRDVLRQTDLTGLQESGSVARRHPQPGVP